MKKSFIKGKKLFELPLDDKARLIVNLDTEPEDYYFDSALYFFDGKNERLLIHDSLAFNIGKNLYERSFCINEYSGGDFDNELNGMASLDYFDRIGKFFELSECVNYAMYLFREKGRIRFLLYQFETISKEKLLKFPYKKIYEAELSDAIITQWQETLDTAFIPKYIAELKKSDHLPTEDQIINSIAGLKMGKKTK